MKRASELELESVPLLGELLLGKHSKDVQRIIVGYAYRSAPALMLTCKALQTLLKADRMVWTYGMKREVALRIYRWPPNVVEVFLARFDSFFDDWPVHQWDRPERGSVCSCVAWMFGNAHDRITTRISMSTASYGEQYRFALLKSYYWRWRPDLVISTWLTFVYEPQLNDWCVWYDRMQATPKEDGSMPRYWDYIPGALAHCYVVPAHSVNPEADAEVQTSVRGLEDNRHTLQLFGYTTAHRNGGRTICVTPTWMSLPGSYGGSADM